MAKIKMPPHVLKAYLVLKVWMADKDYELLVVAKRPRRG